MDSFAWDAITSMVIAALLAALAGGVVFCTWDHANESLKYNCTEIKK